MKRTALLTGAALLVLTGVAWAASYKTGRYEAGAQSGFRAPGIRIDIHRGSFNVERILMHETCSAPGHPTIHDFGGFQQGTKASLRGPIASDGDFSGIYRDGHGGHTKVTGHIAGHTLTVSGTESGHYVPSGSNVRYACHASGTFRPTHV